MRTAYHDELAELRAALGAMCELSGVTMEHATRALLQADVDVADRLLEDRRQMEHYSAEAEEKAFKLLALQAPVAGELREVLTGLQIVADIDRMYALALHVAKVARLRHPAPALPEEVRGYFAEMGRLAVRLADGAREVLQTLDPQAALELDADDDAMDDLHRHLFSVLMDREWPHGVAAAVDVTLLGRYYERFADHAVAVGRRVVFQATGKTPEQFAE
ncbi:MAG TPA: phosphate signaling complex protein PhoU [Gordonia sp. (in: high G+C Gram-positive bacteria)]|uniref:phosphate signaling complex protein PhoU n=1 Tax=unclassified Gordonia (in: high G+C Gram-positive bacteria) TaxID=2657482 RepID=UPI000FB01B5F|nr:MULTISPECIES: phosphate signaling complex protein PhoU [unclassified Gordonia (in: high G+C Gram-positive bacteria)]RTL03826.1 MAG: phosphate signaling complex protein PhoU [Acidimicrobiia bacterium]HNP55699.1 phosphate signaling complex protein PhoU [Gordonia sp. (in: high G+C Gram-positive bacteria)]HRC49435.1 phosphate signaling complex protein PhoU [Gordonia sp. (in: high G+C Gram-positive bacteria)]